MAQKTVTEIPANPLLGDLRKRKRKLRVAAYCRVSSEKDEQLNSFEVQVSYYTEKINSKAEWKFAGVYADEGITGNDHFMFQDLNNDVIADHIEAWIQENVTE